MCFEHIDARARKCHHCSAPQSKWANVEGNPWAMGMIALILFVMVGNVFYSALWVPQFKEHARELSVSVTRLDFKDTNSDRSMSCLGTIANTSKYDWKAFQFEVQLYDANNNLIDTFSESQVALVAPAGSRTAFRTQGAAALPDSQYRKCEVLVKNASLVR